MFLVATGLSATGSAPALAAGCSSSVSPDFNGDGARDAVVADPEATVAGVTEAGALHIVYGDGEVVNLTQESAGIPGVPEKGDRYGQAIAVGDLNSDGCSDLVVGTPYEDIGTEADAGAVHVVYGAEGGLNSGPSVTEYVQGSGGGTVGNSVAEAGDTFGYSVAAGDTASGEPYLLMGVPGEDIGDVVDAGSAHYIRNGVDAAIHQDKTGMPNPSEQDDRLGFAVAASPRHIALGRPGENGFAGNVVILSHTVDSNGLPTTVAGIDQSTPGINGAEEPGDRFATSLTVVPYGGDAPGDSIVVVGVPYEDTSTGEDAGRVVSLHVTAAGQVVQLEDIHQSVAGVTGVGEDGDYFGQQITAVNRDPGAPGSTDTALLAVGIPGEDIDETQDAGSIEVFPLLGAPGDHEVVVEPGTVGLPGQADAHEYLGTSIRAKGNSLYVGVPYGPDTDRAAHSVPWGNILDGGAAIVTSWTPGQDGVPAGGTAFGAVVL
ncbi:FG-GAP and VCBS repeat-containing protein [Streptomyces sp. JJ36]|uniref:FG-GAP and VCBS repeat-containing protein n=1 Tax=Streptomyces sp. JJ36 TaxID=2736645 RepID=UPI001F37A76C|nr:FG-GAP and VCBS repeat-containing protein [Streptomyces sp. JJ36]